MSKQYGKSGKTLRKLFDKHAGATGEIFEYKEPFVLIMDATFFGNGYGILMARNLKKVLFWQEIVSESIHEYEMCLNQLNGMGYRFCAFVVDGRPGVRQLLMKKYPGIPIQLCQFHQIQIVKRYIPNRAKTEAARELRQIAMGLTKVHEKELEQALNTWHAEYEDFLKEKTFWEGTNRWRYTHGRLRSAYRSLRNNLPNLFTFHNHPNLQIPNTTNHCDGLFAHLKQKILVHRGISKKRRKQMIDYFLENF
ncbi:transposase [Candidatus Peregrinibacteria bacterium]|nr:transposase [Candidatus Peregrinibacteria bacterium]